MLSLLIIGKLPVPTHKLTHFVFFISVLYAM